MNTHSVISYIKDCRAHARKLLALLIDPDKQYYPILNELEYLSLKDNTLKGTLSLLPDLILVGGSTGTHTDRCITDLRSILPQNEHGKTQVPIVLFPGNIQQVSSQADAILFLSMLSAEDYNLVAGQQIQAAPVIKEAGIESIPMAYILVDGGFTSSVQQTTRVTPIPQNDFTRLEQLAIASELLGKQLIYIEAGSGAPTPVSTRTIAAVRKATSLPLIVGGGIRSPHKMQEAFQAGADIVVIGNHFESQPADLPKFIMHNS